MGSSIGSPHSSSAVGSFTASMLMLCPARSNSPTSADSFALLDEWAPMAKRMARDEALAELARRYFTSHSPGDVAGFCVVVGADNG